MKDHKQVVKMLKTARGQIDGILKMLENERYCIDVINQIMAVEGMLNGAKRRMISDHLKGCVNNAETPQEREEKIDEIVVLMSKIMK